jgi:DNA-directed RNA polymerase specialized sigma24 family protein
VSAAIEELALDITPEQYAGVIVGLLRTVDDPIARLETLASVLEEWRKAEDRLLDVRRAMVEGYEEFLSYRQMADALGCSKANIHQILHPQAKAG